MNLPWNMTWLNIISLVARKLQSFEQMFGWHFRKIYHSHLGAPGEISDNKRHYGRFYNTMKVYMGVFVAGDSILAKVNRQCGKSGSKEKYDCQWRGPYFQTKYNNHWIVIVSPGPFRFVRRRAGKKGRGASLLQAHTTMGTALTKEGRLGKNQC